jgi:monovalent cation:H+ antiporter, CPA1 family
MTLFEVLAVLITLTALIGFVNERYIGLPPTIGVLLGGLLVSLALVGLDQLGFTGEAWADQLLAEVNFDDLLMKGLLSFLLFAGALHINLNELMEHKWTILLLATLGVVLSTLLIGGVMYVVLQGLGLGIPLPYAMLFGALISPTDPIAVLGILKRVGAPRSLETLISGESLFNDGVGVVVFTMIAGLALGGPHADTSLGAGAALFGREAVGGVAYGLVIGYAAYQLLRRVDNYTVEILITLAVVTGGYALAGHLHTSGPIAVVVAGILIGNQGRHFAMSATTREHLDTFWLVVDETLNAILFVLIGLEVLVLDFADGFLAAALLAIPIVLAARGLSVGLPIGVLRLRARFIPYTIRMMTWGGLRGGIAVALALSLPASEARDLVVVMTYAVVIFSILVQGLTVGPLARRAVLATPPAPADPVAVFADEPPQPDVQPGTPEVRGDAARLDGH